MRPANPRLQHAAAPHRDAALVGSIVYGHRFRKAANPTQLDVDDPAAFHLDRRQGVAPVANRFIEANRRIEALLQHGVIVKIVVPQGLLHHQQLKLVKARQVIRIAQPVR